LIIPTTVVILNDGILSVLIHQSRGLKSLCIVIMSGKTKKNIRKNTNNTKSAAMKSGINQAILWRYPKSRLACKLGGRK